MTLRPKSTTLRFPPSSRSRFSDESISENSLSLAARSSMKWTFLLVARISCSWTTWRVRRHRRMATSCSMLFLPLSEAHGLCFLVSSRRAAAGMPPPALRDACRRRFHRRRPGARGPVPPRVRPAPWHHHRCLRSSLWGTCTRSILRQPPPTTVFFSRGGDRVDLLVPINDTLLSWAPRVTPHVSKPHDYVNHMFMRL
jgi:hypothetical protein